MFNGGFLSGERLRFEHKTNKIKKILNEAYGSIPGQYESVEKIADEFFRKLILWTLAVGVCQRFKYRFSLFCFY